MPDTPPSEHKEAAKAEQKDAPKTERKGAANVEQKETSASTSSNDSKTPNDFGPAIEAAKAAKRLQDTADALKKQASLLRDPAERERLMRSAYEKEVQAHGQSKKARAMASGWGQGAAAGVGIASAVGMGLGNLVGVLLSGVTAVPGVLVGSGVGAAHGPWFKLGGGGKKGDGKEDKKEGGKQGDDGSTEDESDDEEAHRAIVEAARQAEAEEGGVEKGKGDTDEVEPAQKT